MNRTMWLVPVLLAAGVVFADDAPKDHRDGDAAAAQAPKEAPKTAGKDDPKELEGMSILGNQEAPKALVIVPWKSSELGDSLGIAPMLDDSKGPVDRDVFLRALSYYEIRSETAHHEDAAPMAKSAHRSKS